jgi:hypothetical protein
VNNSTKKDVSPKTLIQRVWVRNSVDKTGEVEVANKIETTGNFEALSKAASENRVCVINSRIEAAEKSG